MAEMNLPQNKGRRKVQPPRIDLTPMVDLGFLLITFFMFTTSLAQQRVMDLNMPYKGPIDHHPTPFREESTITVIADGGHKLYYYEGAFKGPGTVKKGRMNDVTNIVVDKKRRVAALPASYSAQAHKLHVLIKASDSSQYEDLVKLLDAMLINDVGPYAIVDVTEEERATMEAMR